MEETAILTHQPCDDCGSSDALSVYPEHTFCFSCRTRRKIDGTNDHHTTGSSGDTGFGSRPAADMTKELYKGSYTALPARKLTEETCRFWSYMKTEIGGKQRHCANYLNDNREIVAQKLRFPDKTFPWKFRASFKGLYGQWLWRSGGKMVVITEGELDALSVSQVQQNKWPVVSLPDGAGSETKSITEAMEWLNTFDKIVIFFDNDDAGRKAAEKACKIIPPGKCYVAWTPNGYKDPSDLLVAGKSKAIIEAIWGAKRYVPGGIVSGQAVIDRLKNRPKVKAYPYPDYMPLFNHKVEGIRLGELDTWTSGSGMGKTTVIKALQLHYFDTTDLAQALIHLEEPLEDTGDDLIGYRMGKRVGLQETEYDPAEYDTVASELFLATNSAGVQKLQLYDAFGSLEDASLYNTIRYMAGSGVRLFWLDHLSILVSDSDEETNERRLIDSIMHNLKSLTVELGIYIGLISHLRKPAGSGKSFENGAIPTLDDLRGSGGIKQLSNSVYAVSRDQQAESDLARNTSLVSVLKCRKTGRTGNADYVHFNGETGQLEAGREPSGSDAFDNEEDTDY